MQNGQMPWWMQYLKQNPEVMTKWYDFVKNTWAQRNPNVEFPQQWQQRWDHWQSRFQNPPNASGSTAPMTSPQSSLSNPQAPEPQAKSNFSSFVHQMREQHPEGGLGQYLRHAARPAEWLQNNKPPGFNGVPLHGKKKGLI